MDITTHTPGSFCTAVLRTREIEQVAAFYHAVVGWTAEELPGTRGHALLKHGGKTVASVQQVAGEDSVWVPHVAVEDLERTATDALTLNATLVDTFDVSRYLLRAV